MKPVLEINLLKKERKSQEEAFLGEEFYTFSFTDLWWIFWQLPSLENETKLVKYWILINLFSEFKYLTSFNDLQMLCLNFSEEKYLNNKFQKLMIRTLKV